MDKSLPDIKELIRKDELEKAINLLTEYISTHPACSDEPYYLLGNAYRKQGNWHSTIIWKQ